MLKKIFTITNIFILITCCYGCNSNPKTATRNSEPNPEPNKASLENLSRSQNKRSTITSIRSQSLRDTALQLGAQSGLAARSKQINKLILAYESLLNRVFNFQSMVLDDNVLPPVLTEARNNLNLANDATIRISDINYEIIQQAKFITAPPTWRDYLCLNFPNPEMPDKTLLPQNRAESKIWAKYIHRGWEAGFTQAELIFDESLHRMQRDYNGMVRYLSLLAENKVSQPYVASLDLGITGNQNNMHVNDRVLKITAFPAFNTDSESWKMELNPHE